MDEAFDIVGSKRSVYAPDEQAVYYAERALPPKIEKYVFHSLEGGQMS